MLYLSRVLNKKVEDAADNLVGRLLDVAVRSQAGSYSPLALVLVKKRRGEEICLPFESVEIFSPNDVALKGLADKIQPVAKPVNGDYLWLKADVLDQQIVDVKGARVVRVNDLRIGRVGDKTCVLAIDVSFKGILRRLNLRWLDFLDVFKVRLIDWRDAGAVKGGLQLTKFSEQLKKLHPADLANIIEDLTVQEGERIVGALDDKAAAKVMEELEPDRQKILVNKLEPEKMEDIMQKMPIDEVVDLVQSAPLLERRRYLNYLSGERLARVKTLLAYKGDTAGGLMTTDFVSARPEWTVEKTIGEIKRMSTGLRSILYIYVTDEQGVFKGALSLRRLLLSADPQETIGDVYKELSPISTLRPEDDLDTIIEVMTKYDLYTAAVVGEDHKLAGIVTIDDVMREIRPNA